MSVELELQLKARWSGLPDSLRVSEVAQLLHVHTITVRRWILNSKLPHVRIGLGKRGTIRIQKAALATWVAQCTESGMLKAAISPQGE